MVIPLVSLFASFKVDVAPCASGPTRRGQSGVTGSRCDPVSGIAAKAPLEQPAVRTRGLRLQAGWIAIITR